MKIEFPRDKALENLKNNEETKFSIYPIVPRLI